FVPLDRLSARLADGGPLPPRSVAITFADNYRGFLIHAWPILKERGIPVTLFVHTGHVGSQKGRPKMTWEELRTLAADPLISVQSQTVSHPPDLTKLTDEQLAAEFADSRDAIRRELGERPPMIAYPSGKFDERVARLAREAGYDFGFTEEQTPAEASPDLMRIARYVHTKWKEAMADADRP
ncbi:MAG: polysaccharide deacetylase family protein, partial [Fimbriimonadaceae bacterium]|nr:polysaccharide deacetylase family protein [Fimbriimonadaceae bacterium]